MTEFLIDGRGTGKSAEAIKWVRGAGNRYLVVPDEAQAGHLRYMDKQTCRGTVLHPEKIRGYGSHRYNLGQTVELGVDSLDTLLRTIFGAPVGFVTATGTLRSFSPIENTIIGGSA